MSRVFGFVERWFAETEQKRANRGQGKENPRNPKKEACWRIILKQDFGQLNEDRLYRNMDRLYGKRASIEAALCGKEIKLFSLKDSILLYDLTST
jgi:hypothetical protein